jgi:myosin heavy subunit
MSDYSTITQGKTRIPGINDGEEFEITDVSLRQNCPCVNEEIHM